MLRIGGGALGLALCVAGMAVGQEVTAERPAPGSGMRRVSQILGSTVQLNDGSGYGKVEDIVLGPDNQVEYLVVSHEQQFAMLPWTAGRFDPGQRVVTYGVAPQAIQPMLFAPNALPDTADPAFARRVQTAFPQARLGQGIRRESLRPAPAREPEATPDPDRPQANRKAVRPGPGARPTPVAPPQLPPSPPRRLPRNRRPARTRFRRARRSGRRGTGTRRPSPDARRGVHGRHRPSSRRTRGRWAVPV